MGSWRIRSGRGAGWAGLVEASTDDSETLRQALESRKPVRLETGGKELVFGPYYARAAAFVPVSSDVVVVFGGEGSLGHPTDDQLHSAAMLAADAVGSVSPAKQLADQLEELDAVRAAVAAVVTEDVVESARGLAFIVAESLSCELAAVYLHDSKRVIVAERGWSLTAPLEQSCQNDSQCGSFYRGSLQRKYIPGNDLRLAS